MTTSTDLVPQMVVHPWIVPQNDLVYWPRKASIFSVAKKNQHDSIKVCLDVFIHMKRFQRYTLGLSPFPFISPGWLAAEFCGGRRSTDLARGAVARGMAVHWGQPGRSWQGTVGGSDGKDGWWNVGQVSMNWIYNILYKSISDGKWLCSKWCGSCRQAISFSQVQLLDSSHVD